MAEDGGGRPVKVCESWIGGLEIAGRCRLDSEKCDSPNLDVTLVQSDAGSGSKSRVLVKAYKREKVRSRTAVQFSAALVALIDRCGELRNRVEPQ